MWLLAALFVSLFAILSSAADPGYHVIKTYKLGGEGGWDYLNLDSSSRRLYISRATHVIVIDADSGKPVGDIPDTPGVHGIALAPELGRGFVSNGREGTVTIFDIQTLKLITKVKVGDNPDAILYDPATKRVFTFNGKSHDSTALDAAKGTVLGTIKLEGKPEFAASDGKGEIFVNIEDKSQLDAIDPAKLEVKSRWPLAPCEEPSGLSIDREHRRLFAGCDNKMMAVVDADSGKVLAPQPSAMAWTQPRLIPAPASRSPLAAKACLLWCAKSRPTNSAWRKLLKLRKALALLPSTIRPTRFSW
jgi:DNA-binding beta-propeller fold protein YncE